MPDEVVEKPAESPAPAEPEAKQEATLEELYKQYPVKEPEAAPAPAQKPVQQQTQPPAEQLPADTDLAAIHKDIREARDELISERNRIVEDANRKDLAAAVAKVQELAQVKGKDEIVEGYMMKLANSNPELMQMWNNRDNQPDVWAKALGGVAKKVQDAFASVPDAQLAENQRAMDQSQRGATSSPGKQTTDEDKVMQMSDAQFDNYWLRISNRTS